MIVHRFRGRVLFAYFAGSQIAALVIGSIVWPEWVTARPSLRLPEAVIGLQGYLILIALVAWGLARRGESLTDLFSGSTARGTRWAIGMGTALLGVGIASLYALFLPLMYLAPDFGEWLVRDPTLLISSSGVSPGLTNALLFLLLVIGAPVVEEAFFRGLVLTSIAVRRKARTAVILSSLIFAILHTDVLGSFIFGVVTAVVFLETGTLWLPIVMHATNNGLVWAIAAGDYLIRGEPQAETVAGFQESWWIGAVALCVGAPLFAVLWRRRPRGPVSVGSVERPAPPGDQPGEAVS